MGKFSRIMRFLLLTIIIFIGLWGSFLGIGFLHTQMRVSEKKTVSTSVASKPKNKIKTSDNNNQEIKKHFGGWILEKCFYDSSVFLTDQYGKVAFGFDYRPEFNRYLSNPPPASSLRIMVYFPEDNHPHVLEIKADKYVLRLKNTKDFFDIEKLKQIRLKEIQDLIDGKTKPTTPTMEKIIHDKFLQDYIRNSVKMGFVDPPVDEDNQQVYLLDLPAKDVPAFFHALITSQILTIVKPFPEGGRNQQFSPIHLEIPLNGIKDALTEMLISSRNQLSNETEEINFQYLIQSINKTKEKPE